MLHCVRAHSLVQQLTEIGKARGSEECVQNVVRKYKGPHQKPKPKWEDISAHMCAHMHLHSLSIYQYTVNICYNEFAEVEGIRLIYQDKNIKV